jgi:hypothetical protein
MPIGLKSLIFSLLLLLVACSKSNQSETALVVSMRALVSDLAFAGGATLKLVNTKTSEVIKQDLTYPYRVLIPHGTWNMYLVGYEGSSAWAGPHQCGSLLNVDFYNADAEVTIYVGASNCTAVPFPSIIAEKTSPLPEGQWEKSQWDQAKWGP